MLAVLFMLGIHSAFLAPAKGGILPQLFTVGDLTRASGLMQLTIYSMVVLGPVTVGSFLDAFHNALCALRHMLVAMAQAGFALALGVTSVPPITRQEPFRWNGVPGFLRNLGEIRRDRALCLTVLAIAYLWMFGFVYLSNVLGYGYDLLRLDSCGINSLTAAVSVVIGLGAFAAGKLSGDQIELDLFPIGSIGLGAFGIDLFVAHQSFVHALAGHFLLGFSGGLFVVPLEVFLQARAGEHSIRLRHHPAQNSSRWMNLRERVNTLREELFKFATRSPRLEKLEREIR